MKIEYHLQHPFSSLTVPVLSKYSRKIFVETGTNVGLGIECALKCGFEQVYSIEADPKMAAIAKDQYRNDERVRIFEGNSARLLDTVLVELPDDPAVIYLDAHAIGYNPLLLELVLIEDVMHLIKERRNDIIMIDDVRMFGTEDWQGITKDQALEVLTRINPKHTITFEDTPNAKADLLVWRPDVRNGD